MQLPFDRKRLAERDALDRAARRVDVNVEFAAQGLMATIELSEVVRKLAAATGAGQDPPHDLADKARLYVRPLQAARGR